MLSVLYDDGGVAEESGAREQQRDKINILYKSRMVGSSVPENGTSEFSVFFREAITTTLGN